MPRLTIDHHGGDAVQRIDLGDYIVTERLVYSVMSIRPVESRLWPDRWRAEVERVCKRADWAGVPDGEPDAREYPVEMYQRGEGPADHACASETCEGCGVHPAG